MCGFLARTIENRGGEVSSEHDLLQIVHRIWDLRGIRVIGPRLLLRVGHGSGVYEDRSWRRVGSRIGRRGFQDGEGQSELCGRDAARGYKSSDKASWAVSQASVYGGSSRRDELKQVVRHIFRFQQELCVCAR